MKVRGNSPIFIKPPNSTSVKCLRLFFFLFIGFHSVETLTRMYKRITCSQFNFLILHFSLNDVLLVPEKIVLKYNDAISNTIFFVTIFLLTIIRRSKVLKKEIKTKHKANKEGWRESNKLSKKGFLQFFLKSGYTN